MHAGFVILQIVFITCFVLAGITRQIFRKVWSWTMYVLVLCKPCSGLVNLSAIIAINYFSHPFLMDTFHVTPDRGNCNFFIAEVTFFHRNDSVLRHVCLVVVVVPTKDTIQLIIPFSWDWIWIGFTSGYRVATALGIVYWTSLSILGLAASRLVRLFPVNNSPQGYNWRESMNSNLIEKKMKMGVEKIEVQKQKKIRNLENKWYYVKWWNQRSFQDLNMQFKLIIYN